jgi:ribosome biogenesis GTPase
MQLEKLGFDSWFEDKIKSENLDSGDIARITAVHRNNFTISCEKGELTAELSGRFLYNVDSNIDMPAVGDWVTAQIFDDDSVAIVNNIVPRKSLLKRKSAGKNVEFQLIAANVDTAFIIQSADNNFNMNRFERYLVLVNDTGIEPVFLLSKSDLVSEEQISDMAEQVDAVNPDCRFIAFSNETGNGIDQIKEGLEPSGTYCLLGSSGVGKSTLLNTLIGEEQQKVNEVREKDKRGKHTTTSRELFMLDNGSMFIDTPGMREMGNFSVDEGISETFGDIEELSNQCRYSDCKHTNDDGCAVIAAINSGELSEARYENYLKIKKEADYYQMSYLEKRRRDKSFGKMVKEIMKVKKKKY